MSEWNSRAASVSVWVSRPLTSSAIGVATDRPALGLLTLNRSISQVTTGPPIRPPQTMPAIAAVTAIDSAPFNPAASNSGAKARPVAGPPVRVAEPASTPNIGCRPNSLATAMPTRFCSTANPLAMTRNTATWRPLTLSRRRLALTPMEVKKAIISGDCRLVSSLNSGVPRLCAHQASKATSRPPSTGSGRL